MHFRTMSNAPKYVPRTFEQREIDAQRNAVRYAREKRVNSMLTAKYLKAKATFDTYYSYDIAEAFNPEDGGSWREEKDPWLRFPDTLPEFLGRYAKQQVQSGNDIAADELQTLAEALIRVAKVDLEGAGRDGKAMLDAEFKKSVLELVGKLKAEYNLPQSRAENYDDADDDVEE